MLNMEILIYNCFTVDLFMFRTEIYSRSSKAWIQFKLMEYFVNKFYKLLFANLHDMNYVCYDRFSMFKMLIFTFLLLVGIEISNLIQQILTFSVKCVFLIKLYKKICRNFCWIRSRYIFNPINNSCGTSKFF